MKFPKEQKKGPRTAGLLGDGKKKGGGSFQAIAFSRNVIFLGPGSVLNFDLEITKMPFLDPWSVHNFTKKIDKGRSLINYDLNSEF